MPVLCELEVGIQQVADPKAYRKGFRQLLPFVKIWPLDETTAQVYGEVYHELKRTGRALSQVDMIVASLARQMKLIVLTTDRDFEGLSGVGTENWSA